MLTFRKATLTDVENLTKLRTDFLQEVNSFTSQDTILAMQNANRDYFKAALPHKDFIAWLALNGNTIVATSGITFATVPPTPRWPNGKTAHIMNIYTLPAYRKQGIAMQLLARVIQEAKDRHCTKITLNATQAGRPLYLKCGFKDLTGDMALYLGASSEATQDTCC